MTRKAKLETLLAKLESGDIIQAKDASDVFPPEIDGPTVFKWLDVYKASQGSIDAAQLLHNALIPNWTVIGFDQASYLDGAPWGCYVAYFERNNPKNNLKVNSGHRFSDNAARAWLVAIIKALILERK